MSKSKKGGQFEREFCKTLSLWWSDGKDDALFWRTAGSGARAKVRGRRGKDTANQHGDITATDPSAQPFIDLLTVELKRGYSKFSVADLLDKPKGGGIQVYEGWFEQAEESHRQAGSFSWMIVSKRDRREAVVFFPRILIECLWERGLNGGKGPLLMVSSPASKRSRAVYGMTLSDFLSLVKPDDIRSLAKTV